MLDLKAKLAAAGLVSKEDVERAERKEAERRARKSAGKGKPTGQPRAPDEPKLAVAKLRERPKGELYDAVRKLVDRVRLDPVGPAPTDDAAAFHFAQANGKVGRLVLEPAIVGQLGDGTAGLVAYMSNHGLAHAVVPAACARDIAELVPLWLRVLAGDERAGALASDEKAP
ncbi:MAG TPA: DUF2058 family protein [Nannocystaceae bacterium]|nr:DUF2058 family protein [Nannocystaceae bacterium]